VNCQYAISISDHVNTCSLKLYGGRPSKGTCAICIERGENNLEFASKIKNNPPPITQQAKTLSESLFNWALSGFNTTPANILSERESICRTCPEWDEKALNNTGRCRKCGCSTLTKLRMATERCPLGKWQAVDKDKIIVEQDN
jgi:predicted Zn-ribbon and HTH transcriptional regulator